MKENSSVKVYQQDQLYNLLLGKAQPIGAGSKRSQEQENVSAQFDFSRYSFPAKFRTESSTACKKEQRSDLPQKNRSSGMKQFTKLHNEMYGIQKANDYLSAYQSNGQRKALMMHQDLEEHYMVPLQRKIAKKVCGPEYEKFRKQRFRAITAFDRAATQNDTFLEQLPNIPSLHYNTSGIVDPCIKYLRNVQKEQLLAKTIALENGSYKEPLKANENDTMNLRKWKILSETRFYNGTEGGQAKGRKVFQNVSSDSVGKETNMFD